MGDDRCRCDRTRRTLEQSAIIADLQTVYGRHDDHDAAVVSFLHPTMNSEDLAHLLDARGFAVRTGHHCAQPLLDRLEITGTLRVSLYFYNTHEEVELFVEYFSEILERFA